MPTLDLIPTGKLVKMLKFHEDALSFRHKLLAMGLTPGICFEIIRVAPFGDPIQISLRGYQLSLRKKECKQIEVELVHRNEA